MRIRFGTSGWRGVISDEITFANVRIMAQAIIEYLESLRGSEKGICVVLGYDTRFLSEEFATVIAQQLMCNGATVLMTNRDCPTPVVGFHIRHTGASGGIVVTASHNPSLYSGIKFSPAIAGPAPKEITEQIEAHIQRIVSDGLPAVQSYGEVSRFDPREEYFEALQKLVNMEALRGNPLRIGVDAQFGTTRGYLDEFLHRCGCEVFPVNAYINPLFGGRRPDASKDSLQALRHLVLRERLDLGLACDGDGDRFGVISAKGMFVEPNRILPMLLQHLVNTRGAQGKRVVRTVATSHQIDVLAQEYGLSVLETPVGFKYVGAFIARGDTLLGGEESGGLSIMGHLPEKDGILACMLIAEMVASQGKSLEEIQHSVEEITGRFYNARRDCDIVWGSEEQLMRRIVAKPPEEIGGHPVHDVVQLDGIKLILKDGSWILIRPSGTEPLVRYYGESKNEKILRKLMKDVQKVVERASRADGRSVW